MFLYVDQESKLAFKQIIDVMFVHDSCSRFLKIISYKLTLGIPRLISLFIFNFKTVLVISEIYIDYHF